MVRTGILGGTFNPIHSGHLIIAEQAYQQFSLDRVLIMPSGVSYLKKEMEIPEGSIRLKMAELAIRDNPHFEVSDMEIRRGGNTYTADTIEELNKSCPDNEFFFITGADTFHEMGYWINPDRIFSGCSILVAVRNNETPEDLKGDMEEYALRYNARVHILNTPNIEISSSMIRNEVQRGRSIRYFVPEEVRQYISDTGLYE